jgi:hypothetical protein
LTPSQRLTKIHTLRRKIAEQQRRHKKRSDQQRELELLVAKEIKAESSFFGRMVIMIFGGRRWA